jgi:hypothetical protein
MDQVEKANNSKPKLDKVIPELLNQLTLLLKQ